jgi:hypothetical protein
MNGRRLRNEFDFLRIGHVGQKRCFAVAGQKGKIGIVAGNQRPVRFDRVKNMFIFRDANFRPSIYTTAENEKFRVGIVNSFYPPTFRPNEIFEL